MSTANRDAILKTGSLQPRPQSEVESSTYPFTHVPYRRRMKHKSRALIAQVSKSEKTTWRIYPKQLGVRAFHVGGKFSTLR